MGPVAAALSMRGRAYFFYPDPLHTLRICVSLAPIGPGKKNRRPLDISTRPKSDRYPLSTNLFALRPGRAGAVGLVHRIQKSVPPKQPEPLPARLLGYRLGRTPGPGF